MTSSRGLCLLWVDGCLKCSLPSKRLAGRLRSYAPCSRLVIVKPEHTMLYSYAFRSTSSVTSADALFANTSMNLFSNQFHRLVESSPSRPLFFYLHLLRLILELFGALRKVTVDLALGINWVDRQAPAQHLFFNFIPPALRGGVLSSRSSRAALGERP